eukprot:NODE_21_length_42443_cov_0.822808.p15 type:complete len:304 gc:universal NODE_21_length_42443_cov_0.822808:16674-15763(-)
MEGISFIWLTGFVSCFAGLRNYINIVLSIVFRDKFLLDPSQATLLKTIAKQPWNMKLIFGMMMDLKPMPKAYLILSNLILCLGLFGIYNSIDPIQLTLSMLALNLGGAMASVVMGGEMIKWTNLSLSSRIFNTKIQSSTTIAFAVGGIISSLGGGYVVINYGTSFFIKLLIPCSFFVMIISLLYKSVESERTPFQQIYSKLKLVFSAFFSPEIFHPMLFFFIQNSTSISVYEGMTYFRLSIGMDAQILGYADTFSFFGMALGSWLFQRYLSMANIREVTIWTTISNYGLFSNKCAFFRRSNTV